MRTLILLFALFYLAGCTTTSFVSYRQDANSDVVTKTIYSGVFNGFSHIVDEDLALEGVLQLTPKAVGRTGMGEQVLLGNLTLYAYNTTSESQTLHFGELDVARKEWKDSKVMLDESIELPALAQTRKTRIKVASFEVPVSFYETEVSIAGKVEHADQSIPFTVLLVRLSRDELRALTEESLRYE